MPHNKIIGIVGPKGSGKTFLAAKMFGGCEAAVLYDIAHDEAYVPRATDITNDTRRVISVMYRSPEYRVIYQVNDGDIVPRGKELIYTTCVPIVTECYNKGDMTLFLDEAHELCTQWSIDWQLRKVIRLARHSSLNIVWISQSVNEIHRDLRRNTDEYYFFKIHEPGDLKAIAERCGDLTADKVANLRRLSTSKGGAVVPGECLVWSAENAHQE